MTYKDLNNFITEKCHDEVDRMFPLSEDMFKGLFWAVMVYLLTVFFIFDSISCISLVAWGIVCAIIGARMTFYYTNKRVNNRIKVRTMTDNKKMMNAEQRNNYITKGFSLFMWVGICITVIYAYMIAEFSVVSAPSLIIAGILGVCCWLMLQIETQC